MDVIIIGAGVIGSSIALGLSRRGLKTLNIDALPAAGFGSTSNSSGIIRPFYSAIEMCALAQEARSRWLDWPGFLACEDERGQADYVECGMLMLLAYSLGIGLPLFLFSLGVNYTLSLLKKIEKYLKQIHLVSGIFLVLVGILLATNYLHTITIWLIEITGFTGV